MPILAIRAANFQAEIAHEISNRNHTDEQKEELNEIMALLDIPTESKLEKAVKRFYACIGEIPKN